MTDDGVVAQPEPSIKSRTELELEEKFPNRPVNHSKTFPFHFLYKYLFDPLLDNRRRPTGRSTIARKKLGPHGPRSSNPNETRKAIIVAFISRWRKEVGDDIYPAFRLIMPDKDRERAMYGLKELTIGKLLVKMVKIDPDSEDAYNLKNWKSAGAKTTSNAGDFSGRCYDLLSRRALRSTPGDLTIEEVNEMLDRLSVASKEDQQLHIMLEFYQRMNATELTWLIRIILRQMKIGATEKTFLDMWHPDAETLFNVSSNLRRICWELYSLDIRLGGDESDISLMSCFQPQLAQFQMHDFEKMVQKMRPTEQDNVFWVEEKLDGERMQLHMKEDSTQKGGMLFGFWSRKAKDYTYLYGNGFYDDNSALTRHLKHAFNNGVRNIILDGEMITWSMEEDRMMEFGTLKTAALEQQKDPSSPGHRPLYRIFDILYLNDQSLTKWTLRDRRRALEAAVNPVHRRMEIHSYEEATTAKDIEPLLREVIKTHSEGLVLKNPRSAYHLNERNDDWMKVKPEYMTEYGEALDCVVIGGYYGSGHRGGNLSTFLCGLRIGEGLIARGENPQQCYSFCKVGGGFSSSDYAQIRHATEGKWRDWDTKNTPKEYVVLAGGAKQFERPDVWIKPEDSVVIAVKAASISGSPQFALKKTLRFPRFKALRTDKDWKTAMSIDELEEMFHNLDLKKEEKQLTMDDSRRTKRTRKGAPKPLQIAGASEPTEKLPFEPESSTKVFSGLTICIMSNSLKTDRKSEDKSKAVIEQLVKHHGASLTQSPTANKSTICIADREPVSVSGLKKQGSKSIIRPSWLFDCIKQAEIDLQLGRTAILLPYEPRHVYFAKVGDEDLLGHGLDYVTGGIGIAADEYGDSFAKDIDSVEELRELLKNIPRKFEEKFVVEEFKSELEDHGNDFAAYLGGIFSGLVVHFDRGPEMEIDGCDGSISQGASLELSAAAQIIRFGGGEIASDLEDEDVTTIVLLSNDRTRARELRGIIPRQASRPQLNFSHQV